MASFRNLRYDLLVAFLLGVACVIALGVLNWKRWSGTELRVQHPWGQRR